MRPFLLRIVSVSYTHLKLGMQQGVQRAGLDHSHGLLLVDHALVHQVAGDLQGGGSGCLLYTSRCV